VARDRRIAPGFRKYLQQLESLEPRTPLPDVVRLLGRELPGWRKAGIELGSQPLAEGSVAIIMPFSVRKSPKQPARRGVFKLLKAGIKQRLDEELAIWSRLGEFLDEDCRRYHLPPLDYRETFETVRDLLVNEVRLDQEQVHLAQAAQDYAGMPAVVIPGLLPFCTPRLTAMEQIQGEPLTNHLASGPAHTNFGPLIARALIAAPIFSSRPAPIFHADPHAGNLFITEDERLGILDWSLVGRLARGVRAELVQVLLGAVAQDTKQIVRALGRLDGQVANTSPLRQVIEQSLRQLRWGTLPGVGWLTRFLDQVVIQGGVRLQSDLLLFRKMLLTLEGVLADISGDEQAGIRILDSVLLTSFLRQFLQEWPERWRQPLHSRHFGTQLSSADLCSLYWSSPAICARYWTSVWRDILPDFFLAKRPVPG
jgi:ubiquinone biosynthesis protein